MVAADLLRTAGKLNTVRVSVADTGIGFPEGSLEDIFEPLTRAREGDGSKKGDRKWTRTAFGLAICHKLITMMGGTLDVQSHVGAGTTISFTIDLEALHEALPVVSKPVLTPIEPAPQSESSLAVLIADENSVSRHLARTLLEAAGHRVKEVADEQHLLSAFSEHLFDLILLDIETPHLDGLRAVAKLRAAERAGSHTPIYGLATLVTQAERERGRKAELDGFVPKPIDIDSVLNIIAALRVHTCRAKVEQPSRIANLLKNKGKTVAGSGVQPKELASSSLL